MAKMNKNYTGWNKFRGDTRNALDLVTGVLGRIVPGGRAFSGHTKFWGDNRRGMMCPRRGMDRWLTKAFGGGGPWSNARLASSAVRFGGVVATGGIMLKGASQWARGDVGVSGTLMSGYAGYRVGAKLGGIGMASAMSKYGTSIGKNVTATNDLGKAFMGARRGTAGVVGALVGGLAGIMM